MGTKDQAHKGAGTRAWMTYIDTELRGLCQDKGWRPPQIRRKWSVREKPALSSGIDDYEWKLIPLEKTDRMEFDPANDDWGTYFVLGFDSAGGKFVLQHDNHYVGTFGDHHVTSTSTEIDLAKALWLEDVSDLVCARKGIEPLNLLRGMVSEEIARWWVDPPPSGFLRRIVSALTSRFEPNTFSIT